MVQDSEVSHQPMSNSSEIDTVDLTSSTHPSHLVEKDAFASILAEAQRLESLHLYNERSELLQLLNSLRAVTRNLPAEILSLIFQDVCSGEPMEDKADGEGDEEDEEDEEDIEERDEEGEGESEEEDSDESGDESDSDSDAFEFLPPFVALQLSAVCVRWRSVVQSTPSLWGEVHLVPLPGAINEEADLLSLVLRLSKQLPLVISFDFSQVPSRNTISSSYPEGLLLHPSVDEAIAENMHRFQNLNLCCPSTTWISAVTNLSSRLVRLRIKTPYQQLPPDDGIEDLCLESCVGLRTLVLDKVFNKIRLPLNPAITDLVFNHMPIDSCFTTLFRCLNLVSAHFINIPIDWERPGMSPEIPGSDYQTQSPMLNPSHRSLRDFIWQALYGNWNLALLQRFYAPTLVIMGWMSAGDFGNFWPDKEPLQIFISRLPTSLKRFDIDANMLFKEVLC